MTNQEALETGLSQMQHTPAWARPTFSPTPEWKRQAEPKREEYFEFRRALHSRRDRFCMNDCRRPTHVLLGHKEYHTMLYGAMCYEGPAVYDHRLKGTAPQFEGLIVLHVFQDSLLEVVHLPE